MGTPSRLIRSLLAGAVLAATAVVVTAPVAGAIGSITKVQDSALATASTGTVTATYPSATTAGNLLVATVVYGGITPNFAAPSGWTKAVSKASALGETEIWYRANNPGGITTVAFTFTTGTTASLEVSEYSGADISPLDKTGSSTATSVTSTSVSTSASTAAAGELAVTSFAESLGTTASSITFTPGTSWTNIGNGLPTSTLGKTSDFRTGLAAGTISETETSSKTGTWASAIATFKVACTGSTLTLTSPGSLTFPSVTLNGANRTTSATAALSPSDMTGGGAGWNIQATSTTFTNAGSKTLPTTATQFTSATVSSATGTCTLPTNSITYPVTLPAAATAPTAVKVYNAAANTGVGPSTVNLTATVTTPANAYIGTYTSTWTFTVASGP